MALARETTLYNNRKFGQRNSVMDGNPSMMGFLCTIDTYSFHNDERAVVEVDIHDTGRAQVVYASSIGRVIDYVESREPGDDPETWILIQAGV